MNDTLDDLPDGWALASLSELVTNAQSGFASGKKGVPAGLRQLRMNNIGEEGELVLDLIRTVPPDLAKPNHLLQLDDVVVCTTNSGKLVGKCALFETEGAFAFSNHITRLRPIRNAIIAPFLRWSLWSTWKSGAYDELIQSWVNQSTLPKEALMAVRIRIPPLAEQRRIVAWVEEVLARVNAARERLAKVPAILKRFRQSVLATACSGRLTADWRITEGTPNFESVVLGDICEFIGGSQPAKDHFVYAPKPGYVRLIQIRDYKSDRHLTFIPRAMARRFCSANDVMVGRYGPPLFQILRGLEGAYNVALMKAVSRDGTRLSNDFLFYLLQEPKLRQDVIHFSERTVGQDGVRKDLLEQYGVPLPTIREQNEIVRRTRTLFDLADGLDERVNAATARTEKIVQAIFAKAFRGGLVPTEAELAEREGRDFETAEQLLERIRASRQLVSVDSKRPVRQNARRRRAGGGK